MWFFLAFSTLSWGIAEIFYKKGSLAHEKYSHLKTTVLVGFMMGIYATIITFTQGVDIKSMPMNMVRYLPASLCYIVSMVCSYFGLRFIKESISDPIENSSGAIVPILCAIFLHETINVPSIVGIVLASVGLIMIYIFDKKGKEERNHTIGKKLAFFAFAMPIVYMLLDAVGTFLDVFYVDDVSNTWLINVTENNIEHTANCCYEFTFLIVAIVILVFLKVKHVKFFSTNENIVDENGTEIKQKWYKKILNQKYKILAALFETAGQATYIFALSSGQGIAAVILGTGTVIISLLLSRIFLKEKLNIFQYISIGIVVAGIITLAIAGA